MVSEGCVLAAGDEPVGVAVDVAPDGFAHPVYRSGLALALRLPVVEVQQKPIEEPSTEEAVIEQFVEPTVHEPETPMEPPAAVEEPAPPSPPEQEPPTIEQAAEPAVPGPEIREPEAPVEPPPAIEEPTPPSPPEQEPPLESPPLEELPHEV
jgi:hypothetical protein